MRTDTQIQSQQGTEWETNQLVDAIFENGVLRSQTQVNLADGARVRLSIEPDDGRADGLADLNDLLDTEFISSCRENRQSAPSLEEVRHILGSFQCSLADRIREEPSPP